MTDIQAGRESATSSLHTRQNNGELPRAAKRQRVNHSDTIRLEFSSYSFAHDEHTRTYHVSKDLILERSALVNREFQSHIEDYEDEDEEDQTPYVGQFEWKKNWDNNNNWAALMLDLSNDYVHLLIRDEVVAPGCANVSETWMRLVDLYIFTEYMEDAVSTNMVMDELMATLRVGMPSVDAIMHHVYEGNDHDTHSSKHSLLRRVIVDHIVERGVSPGQPDTMEMGTTGQFWKEVTQAMLAARNAPADRVVLDADGVDRRYHVAT